MRRLTSVAASRALFAARPAMPAWANSTARSKSNCRPPTPGWPAERNLPLPNRPGCAPARTRASRSNWTKAASWRTGPDSQFEISDYTRLSSGAAHDAALARSRPGLFHRPGGGQGRADAGRAGRAGHVHPRRPRAPGSGRTSGARSRSSKARCASRRRPPRWTCTRARTRASIPPTLALLPLSRCARAGTGPLERGARQGAGRQHLGRACDGALRRCRTWMPPATGSRPTISARCGSPRTRTAGRRSRRAAGAGTTSWATPGSATMPGAGCRITMGAGRIARTWAGSGRPANSTVFKPGDVYWLRGAKLAGWGPLAPGEVWDPADPDIGYAAAVS